MIAPRWKLLLRGQPDCACVGFVIKGLSFGFRIGFTAEFVPHSSANLLSALLQPYFICAHLDECIDGGETARPFAEPLGELCFLAIGMVPKGNGQFRLVHHLSALEGTTV